MSTPFPGPLAVGAGSDFEHAVVAVGALLVLGALVSGLARRSFLAVAPIFVLAGFALGDGGLEWLHFEAASQFTTILATVALIVILFRDGLEVEAELVQRAWHLPARKLAVGMPITCGIVAVATQLLTDLSWTESFLVGALLTPTDPVLSSGVVTNPKVPRIIRHSLNLESGLNAGLALAPVLALTMALGHEDGFVWWRFVLEDVTIGFATGAALGYLGSLLRAEMPSHQLALYAL
ncbi:MAG: sodium/hydrogen antiporter, partial [Thermoleophilaceae bacterium]|nr:sodium/hydrogen antiporter [Thermoleophilaceae bacterium]